MPSDHLLESSAAPSPVSRWTVAALALVLTAADGFLATSLRGATGYIQNTQQPFRDWLLYLAVMLPIFAGTVLGALWLARRLVRHGALRLLVGAALVVVLTSLIALAQMGLTAVYDYRSQVQQLTLMHHIHDGTGTTIRVDPGVSVPAEAPACSGLCSQKQGTLDAHVRGLRLGLLLLLVTNGVLVLWGLALRGGRIWTRRGPATTVRPSTTTTPRPPMDATPSFGGESTLEAVPHVR